MKRIQICKKVNASNSLNHLNRKHHSHLNAVSPEILVGQIWLQEEPTTVEIIELNTSDEFDPATNEALDNRFNHAWSFTNREKNHQIEDNYKINNKARERRRLNHENHLLTTDTATNTFNHLINNNFYSDIVENQYIEDSQLIHQQVDCVTMINKNFINSDSSSDTDIEIITTDDISMEANNWDRDKHPYEEEIITYDPELDKETRTIWIYSFKNKHLLAEDDCELADTAAKDMSFCSTSSSTEKDEEKTKDKSTYMRRLGSPIPPPFIPRLNLTLGPTLSTVSEVSEPNKQTSSNVSYKSPKTRFQKQRNSWFMTESDRMDTPTSGDRQLEKSTNIVNWMALSPREKRRRSEEQSDKWVGSLLKLETLPIEESKQQIQEGSEQDNTLRLQVDVDVHVSINEKTPEKRSIGTPNSANVILKSNNDKKSPIALLCAPMDTKGDTLDRGDHTKFGQTQQVLCFSGGTEIFEQHYDGVVMHTVGDITLVEEPAMPEMDLEAFERDEKIEVETATYDFLTNKLELAKENADAVWMKKNAPYLVPAEWIQYAEVADPPLSIELSIPNTAAPVPLPWYKRLFKGLNCFKK